MTFDHPAPWSELELFTLSETTRHIELIDGCLLVAPDPDPAREHLAGHLLRSVDEEATAAGLRACRWMHLRLGAGRVTYPDLVVGTGGARLLHAPEVALVCEVASRHTAPLATALKRQLYADAGIPWYLLAEAVPAARDAVTLRLLRLANGHYVKHAVAGPGKTLKTGDPFRLEISTTGIFTPGD